jgi:hypothetical protein
MPTTVTIELFTFEELSEDAQLAAIERYANNCVSEDWWDTLYMDAGDIGLIIESFDIDRNTIKGRLAKYLPETCRLIRANHGKQSPTYKTARNYLKQYGKAFADWRTKEEKSDPDTLEWGIDAWWIEFNISDEAKEIENDFKLALLEDYLVYLKEEYEYLTSDKHARESLLSSEDKFTEGGTPWDR